MIFDSEGSSANMVNQAEVFLFQGDSITDAARRRTTGSVVNSVAALGTGYAMLAAMELMDRYPDRRLTFYNRGISGDKVFQLAQRWRQDCLDLKPDVVSILVGVNDYCHMKAGEFVGSAERYRDDYEALLERTRQGIPDCRLIIGEPFLLNCGEIPPGWADEFVRYRRAANDLAVKFKAMFIPYQSIFDTACKRAPAAFWAADGVHPTAAGTYLMAKAWVDAVIQS